MSMITNLHKKIIPGNTENETEVLKQPEECLILDAEFQAKKNNAKRNNRVNCI